MLPEPNDAFEWTHAGPAPALICRALEAVAPHLFTTRQWRLGARTSAAAADGQWEDVARAMDTATECLVRVRQVHGTDVVVADEPVSRGLLEGDIIVTDRRDLAVAVQVADCLPVLMADRRTGAVAAVHAGWRGLAARAPQMAIGALSRQFGSQTADLIVAAGPSIGACCYEVREDVIQRFADEGFGPDCLARWFLDTPAATPRNPSMAAVQGPRDGRRWFFDGWEALRSQLMSAGLSRDQIFIAEMCTASHPDTFSSYRRDGAPAGRIAGAIRSARPRP
jgi:YfiH family protein